MKKNIIAYYKDINLVPLEDSWIVLVEIMEREIPPPYINPRKPRRRRIKRRCGVGELFPTIKK